MTGMECVIVFVTLFLALSGLSDALPCKENSATLNLCIQQKLNKVIPLLAGGWDGLPGVDPLLLPPLETSFSDDNMSVTLSTKGVKISGFSSAKVHAVKSKNLYMGKLEVVMKVPEFTVNGFYTTEGVISTFPLSSSGPFNVSMSDVTLVWIVYLERYQLKTGKRLAIENLSVESVPQEIHIQPAPMLDGNSNLGKTLEVYLNQNSFELYNMVKPRLMKFISTLTRDMTNSYLSRIPDTQVFIPS